MRLCLKILLHLRRVESKKKQKGFLLCCVNKILCRILELVRTADQVLNILCRVDIVPSTYFIKSGGSVRRNNIARVTKATPAYIKNFLYSFLKRLKSPKRVVTPTMSSGIITANIKTTKTQTVGPVSIGHHILQKAY